MVVLRKNRLFGSKNLIVHLVSALDRVPLYRWPVYVWTMGLFTIGPFSAQFVLISLPCQECLFDMGVATLTGLVVMAFPLEMANFCGFLLGRLYKEGRNNRVSSRCHCKSLKRSRQSYRWLSPLAVSLPFYWKSRTKSRRMHSSS